MADDPLAESDTDDAKAGDSDRLREVHDRALKRFDTVAMPQQEIRAQALEARRFIAVPGAMWEGAWGEQFENSPRPEVDKITKALEKIETDYRENRLTVSYLPATDGSASTAETLNGMHRADAAHFKAQQARDNAFQEAIRGGFGAYRLTTDYADPYDPDDDSQRVNPGLTIVDADQSVYFDGASILYDKSDAKWAFVVTADQRADAEEAWGDKIADWPLITKLDWSWDWYTPDVVYKAEYYEVEDTTDKLLIFTQEQSGEEQRYFETEIDAGERADLKKQGWKVKTRPIKRRRVHKYILNGSCVLRDCGYIAGPNIPIVPIYGKREWVDGLERFRGHVQKMMDRQRIYNATIARFLEMQAIAPFEVPIVDPEQVDPHILEQWANGNIERQPLRLLKALRNSSGDIVSAGPIGRVQPPQVQPADAQLIQIAAADLADSDDTADQVKANVSADAMDIAAQRVDETSGIYLDNARQSFQREGEIYLGMAREVYYEPGREVETLTLDGKEGREELARGEFDNGVYKTRNDLTVGGYKVVADVQESTSTKRQKTVRQSLALADAFGKAGSPQDALAALYTAAENVDGEGVGDLISYYRQRSIASGSTKPTPEEQKELKAAAAQKGQQPDPQAIALQAATEEAQSKVALNAASAQEKQANAMLKTAQAQAVGGPEKAPEVPSGLDAASNVVDIQERAASAELKRAQAAHLNRDGEHQRIRLGRDLADAEHQREMDRRAADREDRNTAA